VLVCKEGFNFFLSFCLLVLGGKDGDLVGEGLADGVGTLEGRAHDGDLEADGSGAEVDVALGGVAEDAVGVAGLEEVSVAELHGLSTLTADLAGDVALSTDGAGVNAEADDAHSGTADGELVDELEAERLGLGHGAEAAVLDAVDEEGEGTLLVAEALLDEGGELAHALALVAEDLLGLGGLDDDLGAAGGDAVLNTGEAILRELTLEELEELSVVDSVADNLALLGEDNRHSF